MSSRNLKCKILDLAAHRLYFAHWYNPHVDFCLPPQRPGNASKTTMRTSETTSQTALAISHHSQHASKLAQNTMDVPTGHGGRGRRWGRATSRRATPAERRHQSTFPAPRIARKKKVSLSVGTSHQPPRYTCCNQITNCCLCCLT